MERKYTTLASGTSKERGICAQLRPQTDIGNELQLHGLPERHTETESVTLQSLLQLGLRRSPL